MASRIGAVRGAEDNSYTAGVICAKVSRYAERIHHPDRLTHPLLRTGPKGSTQFKRIGWDEALDRIAGKFSAATPRGMAREAVWPFFYAGTMGLVQRDGINRLRHRHAVFAAKDDDLHDAAGNRLASPASDKAAASIRGRWRNPI